MKLIIRFYECMQRVTDKLHEKKRSFLTNQQICQKTCQGKLICAPRTETVNITGAVVVIKYFWNQGVGR